MSMSPSRAEYALPGLAVLEQSPIIIEKIVHLASDEQMHWKPAADRWSIGEVLGHLAEVEVMGFRERVEKMRASGGSRGDGLSRARGENGGERIAGA